MIPDKQNIPEVEKHAKATSDIDRITARSHIKKHAKFAISRLNYKLKLR